MTRFFNSGSVVVSLMLMILVSSSLAVAQIPAASRPSPSPPPGPTDATIKSPNDPPLTTFEEEIRAKRAIKMAEKDHEENLKRAQEIADIGKDLKQSLRDKSSLDRDTVKKVERLEKLTKKVRGEAGGEDEEITFPNRPSDFASTVTQIADATESLSRNVHDTPRQVVSASVIGDANVLLELIKMLRGFARP